MTDIIIDMLPPAAIGYLLGLLTHWALNQQWHEEPIDQRPGVEHPGHQPERPSDQPAEPPDIGTVVQEPDGAEPEREKGYCADCNVRMLNARTPTFSRTRHGYVCPSCGKQKVIYD